MRMFALRICFVFLDISFMSYMARALDDNIRDGFSLFYKDLWKCFFYVISSSFNLSPHKIQDNEKK